MINHGGITINNALIPQAGTSQIFFNYDFKGKLPYSWPSRSSINPLNVGTKDYNPLFEYGYGLSYQD